MQIVGEINKSKDFNQRLIKSRFNRNSHLDFFRKTHKHLDSFKKHFKHRTLLLLLPT